jgi:hypothetical protein
MYTIVDLNFKGSMHPSSFKHPMGRKFDLMMLDDAIWRQVHDELYHLK